MDSMTSPKFPIIDLSGDDLLPGSASWIFTRDKVRQALEEFGCFEAYCGNIPLVVHEEVYTCFKELFSLPLETKSKHFDPNLPLYGYSAQNEHYPIMETTGLYEPDVLENVQTLTNLMWPQGHPTFCDTLHSYVQRIVKLERMVKSMIFESLKMEKYLNSNIETTEYLLRVYEYTPNGNVTSGLPDHTDKSFLTILHQNGVDGLEVETKEGESFILTPSPKSFVVMLGDSFTAWSNGRLHSPFHRVTITGTEIRRSLALFSQNKEKVRAPEELVDEEHPLLFKPFHHLDLLRHYYYSKKVERSSAKDFYGV